MPAADQQGGLDLKNKLLRALCLLMCVLLLPLGALNLFCSISNLSVGIGMGSTANVLCGLLNLAVAVLLGKGWMLLNEKKKKLEKDAQLFE